MSPRSRRLSRPLPFTVAIPPPPANFDSNSSSQQSSLQDPFQPTSRPLRSSHFRDAVQQVQAGLYGQKGRDRERVVEDWYDTAAIFENPLSLAKGREAIGDLFGLLALVPGVSWSELGDVTESHSFDGHRILTFTHTLHLELLPFLRSEQVQSFGDATATPSRRRAFSVFSLPGTPFPQTPSASIRDSFFGTPTSDGIFSKTHPAISVSGLRSLLSILNPKLLASSLTTLNLKLHTKLLFSVEGKIVHHEDVWGLKELIELLPFGGFVYSLNRQGLGWMAGAVSRRLVGREAERDTSKEAVEGEGRRAECSTIQTPEDEEISAFPIQRPPLVPLDIPRSTGLGLVSSDLPATTTTRDQD
ncbi:uncharacterized protein JCM6883_007012 [Sporobolomyces salmoneus]|uniref:uncharacterized protein n=1 Tax=Sporobolomyces salmoneus TaxID=183962 RepID=UPI00317FA551